VLGAAPAVQARWYQVEVLVLQHLSDALHGGEQWPLLPAMPDYSNALELATEAPPAPLAVPGTPPPPPTPFVLLPRGERRLAGAETSLRASADYAPLVAAAWRQPSYGVAGARRVYLADVPRTLPDQDPLEPVVQDNPRVEGAVTVKIARLMHVDVDFIFEHRGSWVRLAESRNVKLRQVHYFDHPLFGVIVQVTPYALPNEDPAAPVGPDEPEDTDAIVPTRSGGDSVGSGRIVH